jgi:hypothetical protein
VIPVPATIEVTTPVKFTPEPENIDAVTTPVALIFVDCKLATVETPEEFNCPTKVFDVTIPVALIFVDCKLETVDTPEELIFPIRFPIKPNAVAIPLILAPMAVKIPIGDISCPLVLAI